MPWGQHNATLPAPNLLPVLGERGRHVRFLVHDRDAKLCRGFEEVFRSEGVEVLRTPVGAPTANAPAERWCGQSGPSVWTGC
jgi:putative transposase